MRKFNVLSLLYIIVSFFFITSCDEKNFVEHVITIREHKFYPDIIYAKPHTPIKLTIVNEDNTVEEFESIELKREKIVPAKGKITVKLPGLEEGEYKFFGEFHEETAQGKILVKE